MACKLLVNSRSLYERSLCKSEAIQVVRQDCDLDVVAEAS